MKSLHVPPSVFATIFGLAILLGGCAMAPPDEDFPNWRLSVQGDASLQTWQMRRNGCADAAMVPAEQANSNGVRVDGNIEGLSLFDDNVFYACMKSHGWTR